MTLCGVLLVVDKYHSKDGWLGSVAARDHESKTFATKEEAQLWCESVLAELLRKDLESLGVGQVEEAQQLRDDLNEELVRGLKELLAERPESGSLTASEILDHTRIFNETRLAQALRELCHRRHPELMQVSRVLSTHKGIQKHRMAGGTVRYSLKDESTGPSLHDDRCALRKGWPCNCPSAAFTSTASVSTGE